MWDYIEMRNTFRASMLAACFTPKLPNGIPMSIPHNASSNNPAAVCVPMVNSSPVLLPTDRRYRMISWLSWVFDIELERVNASPHCVGYKPCYPLVRAARKSTYSHNLDVNRYVFDNIFWSNCQKEFSRFSEPVSPFCNHGRRVRTQF